MIPVARNATYSIKESDSDHVPVAEQGYDGTISKWEEDQGYSVHQKGLETTCSNLQLGIGARAVDAAKGYYPTGIFSSFPYQGQGRFLPRNNLAIARSNGQSLEDRGKFGMTKRFNRNRDPEAFKEIRGPRATRGKGTGSFSQKDGLSSLIRKDRYNRQDFEINYDQAKFFMIKSFCEDDIHKSIKYSVWASTPSGNKKLDAAYQDVEATIEEKNVKYPIFLFFSVNGSGQFVGLAEMIGQVDFKKSMNFWQQEKWNGFFPVKWHIVKDIPNVKFQSITLENNYNERVTFSRDTQEIRLPQGLKMLYIFQNHPVETSILDDFDFYEGRERALRARRSGGYTSQLLKVESNVDYSVEHLEAAVKKIQCDPDKGTFT